MFFLYLDESGNANVTKPWRYESDFFVLAGTIIREQNYKVIEKSFIEFKAANLPEPINKSPLHAVDMNNITKSSNPYYGHLSYDKGKIILQKVYEFLATQPMEITGAIIDNVQLREKYRNPFDPYELSYEFVLEIFQKNINRLNGTELGMVNLAESKFSLSDKIAKLHKKFVQNGTSLVEIPNILGTVNINPVIDSCFYEIADLVCYAYQRDYSNFLREITGKQNYDRVSYMDIICNLSSTKSELIFHEKMPSKKIYAKLFPKIRDL